MFDMIARSILLMHVEMLSHWLQRVVCSCAQVSFKSAFLGSLSPNFKQ